MKKIFQPLECQRVWDQIWVQTVYLGYQQTTLADTELITFRNGTCFQHVGALSRENLKQTLLDVPRVLPSICRYEMTSNSFTLLGRNTVNPYKHGIIFMGHMQTVQLLIRHRIMRCPIRNFTVCLDNLLHVLKFGEKKTTNIPKIGNGLLQLIVVGNFIRLKWIKFKNKMQILKIGSSIASCTKQ